MTKHGKDFIVNYHETTERLSFETFVLEININHLEQKRFDKLRNKISK
jgi:hypothetical protein